MRNNWVKISLVCLVLVALGVTLAGCSKPKTEEESTGYPEPGSKGTIVLATTTSFRDSGLAEVLVKEMEKVSGYTINLVAQGSGATIELLQRGDAQVGITHAPDLEQALVDAGWIRMPFMKNYFYLVGPKDDPAGVKEKTLPEAFQIIHDKQLPFVNRNDKSGTDVKERNIWKSIGLDPDTFGEWYMKTQAGMLNSLQIANEKGAYILTDQSTWMNNKDQLTSLDFITTSEEGENIYSFLYNDPQYQVLADYLKTDEARGLMQQFFFEPLDEE